MNAAELLRLYLDYDLLEECADLAIEYIDAVLGRGSEYFGLKVSLHGTQLMLKHLKEAYTRDTDIPIFGAYQFKKCRSSVYTFSCHGFYHITLDIILAVRP